jgi:hydrogenase maturation protease
MKILIAGMGNVFHGDDGFGCEVIRALHQTQFPGDVTVTVRDFGAHNYDLAYELADGYDIKILVDAILQKSPPGTLYLMEPDLRQLEAMKPAQANPHPLNPIAVLQLARSIGNLQGKYYVVGCEPAVLDDDNGEIALSAPVRSAVPEAVRLISLLIAESVLEDETDTEVEFEVTLQE